MKILPPLDRPDTLDKVLRPMRRQKVPIRTVSPRRDGTWADLLEGRTRASSLSATEAEAIALARSALQAQGGGVLVVKASGGELVRIETVLANWMPRPADAPVTDH